MPDEQQPLTIIDLGKQIKSRQPEYASKTDEEVGREFKSKYPMYSYYADVTPAPPKSDQDVTLASMPDVRQNVMDEALGVAKGVNTTLAGISSLFYYPWRNEENRPQWMKNMTVASNQRQQTSKDIEQALEYVVPFADWAKIGKAANVARGGILATEDMAQGMKAEAEAARWVPKAPLSERVAKEAAKATAVRTAQTGDPVEGTKAGTLGAAAEVGLALPEMAPVLKKMAFRQYHGMLRGSKVPRDMESGGAGRGWGSIPAGTEFDRLIEDIVPEALARKVWGKDWQSLREKAALKTEEAFAQKEEYLNKLLNITEDSGQGKNIPGAKSPLAVSARYNLSLGELRREAREMSNLSPEERDKLIRVSEDRMGYFLRANRQFADSFQDWNQDAYLRLSSMTDLMEDYRDGVPLSTLVKARRILDNAVVAHQKVGAIEEQVADLAMTRDSMEEEIKATLRQDHPDYSKLSRTTDFWTRFQQIMKSSPGGSKRHPNIVDIGHHAAEKNLPRLVAAAQASAEEQGLAFGTFLGATGVDSLRQLMKQPGYKSLSAVAKDQLANLLSKIDTSPAPAIKFITYLNQGLAKQGGAEAINQAVEFAIGAGKGVASQVIPMARMAMPSLTASPPQPTGRAQQLGYDLERSGIFFKPQFHLPDIEVAEIPRK